ncbi:methylase [Paenibacillus pectinilyticus]|uniref:Methylase n=1 Tax=Paenibacillus pectinilyticus TaxID=512399 RepID=A0A1C0ZTG0_9BACL|nr:class I SAM-dependent methyltransferase [Paenibacillus pectinilyticus]OCT11347.1 methylase [Paenibacillus pectinilyticus]
MINKPYNPEMALAYEKNARISIPTYDALFTMAQAYFRMQLGEKEASLLVVGAGGGNELSAWGPSNPNWSFTGVDISEEMLKIAKHKAAQLDIESRVTLIQGTMDDVQPSDAKFDAASCILVLHFVNDVKEKLKLLQTVKAHMKPGAPFVLVTAYGDPQAAELQDRLQVWKSFWLDAGTEPKRVQDMVEGGGIMKISFIPEKEIECLLTEAGFTHITKFYVTGLFGGWMCKAD